MATECNNCNNTTVGTKLFRCRECDKVYCEECVPNVSCDNCDVEWAKFMDEALSAFSMGFANFTNLDGRYGEIEEEEE